MYTIANSQVSTNCKDYNSIIPKFLHGLPIFFIKHCYQHYTTAQSVYCKDDIAVLMNDEKCICIVKSEATPGKERYYVNFGIPNYTCSDFARFLFPCKQFCTHFVDTRLLIPIIS